MKLPVAERAAEPPAGGTTDVLAAQLARYADHLLGVGVYHEQVDKRLTTLRRIFDDAGWPRVEDVERRQLAEWLSAQKRAGKKARTVNTYASEVSSFCAWAVEDGLRHDNPAFGLKRAKGDPPGKQWQAFTPEEVEALIRVADEPTAILYRVLSLSGGRRRETRRVRWCDVKLDDPVPTITFQGKNGRNDSVPLAPAAVAALRRWRELCEVADDAAAVVPKWPHDRVLVRDMTKAGVERKPGLWHRFRKGFASALVEAGVEPGMAQKLLRHRTVEMTMNNYVQVRDSKRLAAVMRMPMAGGETATQKNFSTSREKDLTGGGRIDDDGVAEIEPMSTPTNTTGQPNGAGRERASWRSQQLPGAFRDDRPAPSAACRADSQNENRPPVSQRAGSPIGVGGFEPPAGRGGGRIDGGTVTVSFSGPPGAIEDLLRRLMPGRSA